MRKLDISPAQFATRTRAQNADRQQRIRENRNAAGLVACTVWIPADLKTALTDRAVQTGQPINETINALLLDALTR